MRRGRRAARVKQPPTILSDIHEDILRMASTWALERLSSQRICSWGNNICTVRVFRVIPKALRSNGLKGICYYNKLGDMMSQQSKSAVVESQCDGAIDVKVLK